MTNELILSGILFFIGLIGVLVRRNIIFMLMSVEIMLNSAGMVFVFAGQKWMEADGQVSLYLFLQWLLLKYL